MSATTGWESDEARALLGRLLRLIDKYAPSHRDYACGECVPDGQIVLPGFQCAIHQARAIVGRGVTAFFRCPRCELMMSQLQIALAKFDRCPRCDREPLSAFIPTGAR